MRQNSWLVNNIFTQSMKLKPKQKTTKQGKICELGVKKDDLRRLAKICKLGVHSHRSVLEEKVFLEILQNSQENICAWVSFLIKLQAEACNFIKKDTLTQEFPCKFYGISANTFFIEYLRETVSSETNRQKQPPRGVPRKTCSENMLQIYTDAEVWFQLSCFATLLKSHFGIGVLL